MLNGERLVAATPNAKTYDELTSQEFRVLRLSMKVANKYRQARHAVAMAMSSGHVRIGELIICAVGHNLCHGGGDLVLITDVEPSAADVRVSELVKLTNAIRPQILEAAINIACMIGRASRRGKRVGALIVLGDSDKILQGAKQLILNPFQGHEDVDRRLTSDHIHGMLLELAKLDGAFVVRGDGFIRTAGAFLAAGNVEGDLAPGLGARHATASAVTARTQATAVVVSATDGYIRAFSGGRMVLEMDPDVPMTPLAQHDKDKETM